jgi:polyisoprenoid-binding protein YceI
MKKSLLIPLGLVLFCANNSLAGTCEYRVDPSSIQVNWTAFKTMQKVAVKGSFTELSVMGELEAEDLESLLGQLEAEIDIKNESLIRTGNPGRDLTIFQHFFSHFKKKPVIKGEIKKPTGNGREGTFGLKLTLNKNSKEIPFRYTLSDAGVFEAQGSMDVLDFALDGALKDLNRTCEVLHRGPDGVSKTWSEVELKLIARIGKVCTP